jgi:putative ABC transport system permease protein
VLGQALNLDGGAYTVIGVLPAGFRYVGEPVAGTVSQIDAWFPLSDNPLTGSIRGLLFLKVIGRLKPGVSAARAGDEIRGFGAALAGQYPDSNRGFGWDALPRRVAPDGGGNRVGVHGSPGAHVV